MSLATLDFYGFRFGAMLPAKQIRFLVMAFSKRLKLISLFHLESARDFSLPFSDDLFFFPLWLHPP